MIRDKNKKLENEEMNNLFCPSCNSRLLFRCININTKIFLCSNDKCLFPMNNNDIDRFIFNVNDKLKTFIFNVKRSIAEQSSSEGGNSELKKCAENKDEMDEGSKNSQYSFLSSNHDKHNLFESYSEEESLNF